MKKLAIAVIIFYQSLISPIIKQLFGGVCRFNPTCSEYTKQSIQKYGIIKGTVLGVKQLSSCHPWGK